MDNLPTPVSFTVALDKFISNLKSQKRSSATVIAYNSDLSQLRDHFEGQRITQVTTLTSDHLQTYLDKLASNGYTPKTISRKINSLKTFFAFLTSSRLSPANPAMPLTHPKIGSSTIRVLSETEYKALREACRLDIRVAAIIELLLQTGMRISELANLHLEDVKKTEVVIRALENNASRTIALSKPAVGAVQNYLVIRPTTKDSHLFVTKTGRPLLVRNIRTAIDRYFAQAGIKGSKVNDLRSAFIAHQLQAGVNPDLIAKTVGHKRLSSVAKFFEYIKIPKTTTDKLVEL